MRAYSKPAKAAGFNEPRFIIATISTLIGTLISLTEPAAEGGQSRLRPAERYISGTYTNLDYRFVVRIPSGLKAIGPKPPAPNHGFQIRFSTDESDWLSVVADYDVLELSDTLPQQFDRAIPDYEVLETRRHSIKFAGMDAERAWQRLRRRSDGMLFITDGIGTRRATKHETIVYSVSLHTPEKHYVKRKEVLDKILASFQFLP